MVLPVGRRLPSARGGLVSILALAGLIAAAGVDARPGGDRSGAGESQHRSGPVFRIRGAVGGLFPGAWKDLRVRLSNPQDSPIEVTALWVASVDADPLHPACSPAEFLRTTGYTGSILVPAKSSVMVTDALAASLGSSAPDACQHSRFRLQLRGTAVVG
jgi:hypothetical protein